MQIAHASNVSSPNITGANAKSVEIRCETPFTFAAKQGKTPVEKVEECHRKVTAYVVKRLHPFSDVESPTFR